MAQNVRTVGTQIPTTNVWDVSEIYAANLDPKMQELLVRLYQNLNNMAIAVNLKDAGYYSQEIYANGQQYFPDPLLNSRTPVSPTQRSVLRKVVNFGTLPDTATKSVAHGIDITNAVSFTRIYACSTDPVNHLYVPIPYASSTGDNIELYVDGTNVNIVTNSNTWITYTITYVVLEYITS